MALIWACQEQRPCQSYGYTTVRTWPKPKLCLGMAMVIDSIAAMDRDMDRTCYSLGYALALLCLCMHSELTETRWQADS